VQCSAFCYKWDQPAADRLHTHNAREVDLPITGLLKDLKSRHLLKDTPVVRGGEFGRITDYAGRRWARHNPCSCTMWMAGGKKRGSATVRPTSSDIMQEQDHAPRLYDIYIARVQHEQLTYFYSGAISLTDVAEWSLKA
jgi:hypothetical protein